MNAPTSSTQPRHALLQHPWLSRLLLWGNVTLFAWLFHHIGWGQVWEVFRSARRIPTLGVLVCLLAQLGVTALNWRVWLQVQGYALCPTTLWRITWIPWAWGLVTPGKSGELVVAPLMHRDGVPWSVSATGWLLLKGLAFGVASMVCALGGWSLLGEWALLPLGVGILLGVMVRMGVRSLPRRWRKALGALRWSPWRALGTCVALTLAYPPLIDLMKAWLSFRAFGVVAPWRTILIADAVGVVLSLLPLFPNSLGAKQAVKLLLYQQAGVAGASYLSVVVLQLALSAIVVVMSKT